MLVNVGTCRVSFVMSSRAFKVGKTPDTDGGGSQLSSVQHAQYVESDRMMGRGPIVRDGEIVAETGFSPAKN